MSRCFVSTVTAAMLFAIALSSGVRAEEPPPENETAAVAKLLETAEEHYDAGQFRQAAPLLLEAHETLGSPIILYRLGNVYHNLGNFHRARRYYEQFLANEPESNLRGRVEAKVETLRRLEAASQSWAEVFVAPDGAEIYYRNDLDRPLGESGDRIPLGAGSHPLVVRTDSGAETSILLEVKPGQTAKRWVRFENQSVSISETPPGDTSESTNENEEPRPTGPTTESTVRAPAPVEPVERRPFPLLWPGVAANAVGAGVLAFAFHSDLVRIPRNLDSQQSAIDNGLAMGKTSQEIEDDLVGLRAARKRAVTEAIVGYAAGTALLAGGITMIVVDLVTRESGVQATVSTSAVTLRATF